MSNPMRLTRSNDKVIAGVCGGIAEYMNLDPAIVRLIFVVAVLSGVSPLVYLILWIVLPAPGTVTTIDQAPMVQSQPQQPQQVNVAYEGQENWQYDPFTGEKINK